MVLCSILVHGLSIPFFSLGRRVHSVSRTWSRHDTLGRPALPEWANMTRHVVRGNDIVINRDSDIERGDATVHGDETPPTEKVPGSDSSPTQTTGEEPPLQREEDDFREENPPDGREIVAEWKEGPHNIVERRAGPGEEVRVIPTRRDYKTNYGLFKVEVEVQRNVFGPDETTVHSLKVAQGKAHHAVNDIRARLSQTLGQDQTHANFEDALENVRQRLHDDVQHAEEAVHHAEDKAKHALSPSGDRPSPEDEDEGWQSDGEGEASARGASGGRKQSRSPKLKPPKLAILRPPGQARRRSIRRGMFGGRVLGRHYPDDMAPSHGDSTTLSPADENEEDERGRRSSVARNLGPASPIGPGIGPRHARIDSLRSIGSRSRLSRDVSPARSIRWADEDGTTTPGGRHSGTNTPGIISPGTPLSPLSPLPITDPQNAENGEPDAAPSSAPTVRFSIPLPQGESSSS